MESIDLVRRNQVDLAVMEERGPEGDVPDELVFHAWRSYPAYLLIPIGHPLLRHGVPTFADLLRGDVVAHFPLVVPEARDAGYQRLDRGLRKLELPFNVALEVGTMEAVKRYVSLRLGLGVVVGICLTDDDLTKVAAIEVPSEFGATTTYGVLLRRDKYQTAPLRGLLQLFGVNTASG